MPAWSRSRTRVFVSSSRACGFFQKPTADFLADTVHHLQCSRERRLGLRFPLPALSAFFQHEADERHLRPWVEVREIVPVALPQLVNELPQFPLQRVPVVFEPLENLLQLLTHLAGKGRVLIREADDVVARGVLHLGGPGAVAALVLAGPSRTPRR